MLTRLRSNYQYSDAIGKSGVEKMCEGSLRGKRGYHKYNRIAGAEELRTEVPAAHGRDVRVTIDIKLQQAITQEFRDRGQNGSAVVISVPDGEVLALVSVPTYDLNEYRSIYPVLLKDEVDLPLLHRAVARRYPPGSTAKVITALAGLSGEVLSADSQFRCTGRLFPDYPDRWRCWLSRGHGTLDLLNGIKHSCNVYFYHVGELVGPEQLSAWFSSRGCTADGDRAGGDGGHTAARGECNGDHRPGRRVHLTHSYPGSDRAASGPAWHTQVAHRPGHRRDVQGGQRTRRHR